MDGLRLPGCCCRRQGTVSFKPRLPRPLLTVGGRWTRWTRTTRTTNDYTTSLASCTVTATSDVCPNPPLTVARDGFQGHVGGRSRDAVQGKAPCVSCASATLPLLTLSLAAGRAPEGIQEQPLLRLQRPVAAVGIA